MTVYVGYGLYRAYRGVLAVLLAVVAVLALASSASQDKAPSAPSGEARAMQCADIIGIPWTPEDGATEELDRFQACLQGK